METIGKVLSQARKKRGVSVEAVAEATKIRPSFIRAIEENDFAKLSSVTTAFGFIKNYSRFLGLSSKFALAVFRRDFVSDERGKIVPRGLVEPLDAPKIFSFPKMGLVLTTIIFIGAVLIYLFFQYLSLARGPALSISNPLELAKIESETVLVTGRTDPDATVNINGELIILSPGGDFELTIDLNEGKNVIVIEAVNKLGKVKRVVREVYKN